MTTVVNIFNCFNCVLFLFCCLEFNEACFNETIRLLENLSIRSPNSRSTANSELVTDHLLIEGWYSPIENGWSYVMTDSTSIPTIGTCSTYWPVYLKEKHPPETPFDIVNATACLGVDGSCSLTIDIQIQWCFASFRYFLPPTIPYSAYCFSKDKTICGGEDEAAPDPEFGQVTITPELYHKNVTIGTETNHQPYFLLHCVFNTKPGLEYFVNWYVDGEKINENVTGNNLTLHEDQLDRLGIDIRCAVRAITTGQCGAQTDWTYSTLFYAGIKILTPVITMAKGELETIEIKTTVPIGCNYYGTDTSTCTAQVRMFDPTTSGHVCTESIIASIKTKTTFDNLQCSDGIESLSVGQQWDPNNIFKFKLATTDQNYEDRTTFLLKLEFDPNIGHQKWTTFTFPDIPVRIHNVETYKQKICYSHVDPHMRSADHKYYENQVEGEYMLYINTQYKIEVQEKTAPCFGGWAQCTCAIAVRAGKDVFMINRCGDINYLGFTQCGDRGILQVVKKHDNLYEVFTPIGTKITIQLHSDRYYDGFMNIDITMAPKDENNVFGLCGYFDGNANNDFRHRDNTTGEHGFVQSWVLQETENLFRSPNRTLESWDELNGVYCTCMQNGMEKMATCAPTQYLNCTKPDSITPIKCRIQGRTKRYAGYNHVKELNRLFGLMSSGNKHRIVKREESQNITTEEATDVCTHMINGSLAVRNYSELGGNEDSGAVIDQCVFDVKTGNKRALANAHVESMNTIVKSMMEYEPTYVINNSEKVETFLVNTCPGNCSGNGNCTMLGVCSCKQYHHGATCSIDERDALVIDDIEGGGVCDLAEGDECVCFTIRSDNLLDGFNCKIQTTVYFNNGTNHETLESTEAGDYEDIFTGVCCDNNVDVRSDNTFGLVYDVSISNNGDVFSNIATVHVLNSACQEVVTDAQTPFRLKNQTCLIDGSCYVDGDLSYEKTNTCLSCQSSVDSYDWTEQPCPTTTVSTTTTSSMSTSTSTSMPTTSEPKTDTTSTSNTPSTSTTEWDTTINKSPSSTTPMSTTKETKTDTTSTSNTPSTSTHERETSVTSTMSTLTSRSTSSMTTTSETNTDITSTASTSSTSTLIQETSVKSTINKSPSTPTSTWTSRASKIVTNSGASNPSTSSPARETSVKSTIGLGMVIGLSTGVPVFVIVVVVITVIITVRFKKMKRSALKGKQSGHVATHDSDKGSSMDRHNSFYFENPLNKGFRGIPVARSGHFNVECQTFSTPVSSQSSGDLSAVSVEFKTGTD